MKCPICGVYFEKGEWLKDKEYKHFKRVCVPCYHVEERRRNEPKNNL